MPRPRTWTDDQLVVAVAESKAWQEVVERLGLTCNGVSPTVRERAVSLGLDTCHLAAGWKARGRDPEAVKAARRRHYERNKAEYVKRAMKRNKEERRRGFARLAEIKESNPCTDCGRYLASYLMEYDHLDPTTKVAGITAMVTRNRPWTSVEAEMAKCELVCGECHRIREASRRQAKQGKTLGGSSTG